MSSLGMYGDGGSMRGSGIDERDIRWSFVCESCGHENDDVDATMEGRDVWAYCEICVMPSSGRLDND